MIAPGQQRVDFYSADIDIFSPFGTWAVGSTATAGNCNAGAQSEIDICVEDQPNITYDGIDLFVASDGSIFASNASSPPCERTSAAAFLGHGGPGQPDQDVFRFHGRAGDKVALTLERDGARGSIGNEPRLSLRPDGGGQQLAHRQGRVPLTLSASLSSAGQ